MPGHGGVRAIRSGIVADAYRGEGVLVVETTAAYETPVLSCFWRIDRNDDLCSQTQISLLIDGIVEGCIRAKCHHGISLQLRHSLLNCFRRRIG